VNRINNVKRGDWNLVFGVWVGFDPLKIQNPVLSQVPVIKSASNLCF